MQFNKELVKYLVKFIGCFCILYYGTFAIIGLSAPDNYYSAFAAHYLNFVEPLRHLLLLFSQALLSLLGYDSTFKDFDTLCLIKGSGVRLNNACIGLGVISFWIAFVFANRGAWQKKTVWVMIGCLAICTLNTFRISLLVLASNNNWSFPFGWDHHDWFNIATYACIFLMIYFYGLSDRRSAERILQTESIN